MKILAIDTSGQQAGAAIMDEYITIGETIINAQSGHKTFHHSQILMPAVERLFESSGLTIDDIDYIAYTQGPGSFTGIRIGAATALGLARGINKPAIPVPTLDALAYNVLYAEDTIVVPLLDARRQQVYCAVYHIETGIPKRLTDYFAKSISDTLKQIHAHIADSARNNSGRGVKPHTSSEFPATDGADFESINYNTAPTKIIFLGDGAEANKTEIQAAFPAATFAPQNNNRQRPSSVALYAAHRINKIDTPIDTQTQTQTHTQTNTQTATMANQPNTNPVKIIYVRDPQAVRNMQTSV